jgi:menaquinone-specific isochorismate synthase
MTSEIKLRVRTRPLDFANQLASHLPKNATAFLRDGEGLVGKGCAVKLSASGISRFAKLAADFKKLCDAATIDDSVGGLARGLVAFGSLTFSSTSGTESVLVIPEAIVGLRDGRSWVTQIWHADQPEPKTILSLDDFEPTHSEYASSTVRLEPGEMTTQEFELKSQVAIDSIAKGQLDKLVLARDLVGSLDEGFDLRRAISRLANRYPNCWTYSVDGTFGASPELLVRVTHSQVSARVLAGTASRGTDPQVDRAIATALVESTKNNHEHQFAVNSLVAALEKLCDHVTADDKPFSLALPNVWHLASDVNAVLRESQSSLTLADALHPTAAVAGTPTDIAIEKIVELEAFDRGRYAGPVGWISANGDGEWAIALRGGQLNETGIRAFAGCGLVAESEPSAELAETELKFLPVRYALN